MNELKVKLKIEEMILWAHNPLRNFPNSEKHVLTAEIRQCMYRLLHLTIIANKRYFKKTTIQDLDVELDLLRSLVHFSKEWNYLKFRQYEIWAKYLAEIGSLIGGWIKWVKEQERRS